MKRRLTVHLTPLLRLSWAIMAASSFLWVAASATEPTGRVAAAGRAWPGVSLADPLVGPPRPAPARTGPPAGESGLRAPSATGAWSQLASDRPLAGHDAILDTGGRRMLLHGGESDALGTRPLAMRALDLAAAEPTWSDVDTRGSAPRARLEGRGLLGSRAIVDPGESVALIVCDCANGSTHLFDLKTNTWSRAPGDRLLPYWYHLLAYEAENDRAVLYGGDEKGDAKVSDRGWSYGLSPRRSGWRSLPRAPFRYLHQAAGYEPESGHLVVFSGLDARLQEVDELWRLDVRRAESDEAWRRIDVAAEPRPLPRAGASLTFMADSRLAILYGGYANGGDMDDAWILDYSDPSVPRWSQLRVEGDRPGARAGHSAVWDPQGGRLIVYGGVRGYDYLNDTWVLEPELSPVPTPTLTAEPSPTATDSGSTATSTPSGQASPTLGITPGTTAPPTAARTKVFLPRLHRD